MPDHLPPHANGPPRAVVLRTAGFQVAADGDPTRQVEMQLGRGVLETLKGQTDIELATSADKAAVAERVGKLAEANGMWKIYGDEFNPNSRSHNFTVVARPVSDTARLGRLVAERLTTFLSRGATLSAVEQELVQDLGRQRLTAQPAPASAVPAVAQVTASMTTDELGIASAIASDRGAFAGLNREGLDIEILKEKGIVSIDYQENALHQGMRHCMNGKGIRIVVDLNERIMPLGERIGFTQYLMVNGSSNVASILGNKDLVTRSGKDQGRLLARSDLESAPLGAAEAGMSVGALAAVRSVLHQKLPILALPKKPSGGPQP